MSTRGEKSFRFSDGLIILSSAAALCAFLILEPFRPEVLQYFSAGPANGWIAFAACRSLLLATAAFAFYIGSRSLDRSPVRIAPLPTPGQDPLLTLRVFAFILVVAGHGLALIFSPAGIAESLNRGSKIWIAMGSPWAGVWVFFVLSGYLMAKGFYRGRYGLSRQSIRAFYRNRFLRIAPIYYFVMFITAIFSAPEIFRPSNWWEIVALAGFSLQIGSPHPIVSAMWSIHTEMAFYAVVPLLFFAVNKVTSRYSIWPIVTVILALGWAYRCLVMYSIAGTRWGDRVYIPLIGNLDLFLLGMSVNWALPAVTRWLKSTPSLSIGLALLMPLYVVSTYFFCQGRYGIEAARYTSLLQICGPTLIGLTTFVVIILFEHYASLHTEAAFIPRMMVRGTQTFGVLTYALYAWHEPILLHLRSAVSSDLSTPEAVSWLLLGLLITTAIAFVSHKVLEVPFERR